MTAFSTLNAADLQQLRTGKDKVTTLLDPGQYRLLQIDTPNAAPDELRTAVKWRIKDMLDRHIDDITIDVIDIPISREVVRTPMLMVVAANNDAIQSRIKVLRDASIPLDVIDIPELGLRNVAALLEKPGQAVGMVWFGNGQGLLLVVHHGELFMWRNLETGSGRYGIASDHDSYVDRTVREIVRTLDHVDRHFSELSLSHLAILSAEDSADLVAGLERTLDLPIELAHPATLIDGLEEQLPDPVQQMALLPLIGAALRVTDDLR
ncbi:hypothetical protein [Andreprevotia sp. IGB-42]|uniref:hypothetical protein n=1 Tax=Andreprevotia sp. IGB-42 TaxID=2497473 RepID=UPI0013572EFC|nr:hypothetical protein [Andreprevotia sp. IGB-42]